jgi:hypothetical protein
MIPIGKTMVSDDLLERKFVCDLSACKGACCVEGESGAPLDDEELPILEEILPSVLPYMTKKGIRAVKKHGPYVKDSDGDFTTTLTGEQAECAFVFFDANGIALCAIEKAHKEGKISWKKPISCHLYPVRISRYKEYEAVNYHRWDVCKPACECGKKMKVPVFRFLKDALIRKFGSLWYRELEQAAAESPHK